MSIIKTITLKKSRSDLTCTDTTIASVEFNPGQYLQGHHPEDRTMNYVTLVPHGPIPASWVRLMDTIRGSNWVSFVAGGAVRDFVHGVKPKDVDIWVSADNLDECEQVIAHEFPEAKVLCDSNYNANLRVRKVWEFDFGDTKVNVIVFNGTTPAHCVEEFDLTLSQAFVLPFDNIITVTDAFLKDSRDRVFRQVRKDDSDGRTASRVIASLLPRYPGWSFVPLDPPKYQQQEIDLG